MSNAKGSIVITSEQQSVDEGWRHKEEQEHKGIYTACSN
jgi:hypothetical protein